METMSRIVEGEYPIGEALIDLQESIQRKRNALKILNIEYNKLCSKTETNLKLIEELTSKIFILESLLSSLDCRVIEYGKQEKEREGESEELMKGVEGLKITFEGEKTETEEEDFLFDERVLSLVEEGRKNRELFDCGNAGEQIENLQHLNMGIVQEMTDIYHALIDLKQKNKLLPSKDLISLIENSDLSHVLLADMSKLQRIKEEKTKLLQNLKQEANIMDSRLNQLNST